MVCQREETFTFKRGDQVKVISGTYEKGYNIFATVTADCLQRRSFCHVQFDIPQTGSMAVQKLRGPVEETKLKKSSLQLVEPPEVEVTEVHLPVPPVQHRFGSSRRVSGTPVATIAQASSVESSSSDSSVDIVRQMENMTLEDMPISTELRVRIRDVCLQFKQEGICCNSPSVYAMIAMGMDEMQYY